MIDQKSIPFTLVFIILISVVAGILSYFRIPYQFYIWEFYIDSKILGLLLLLFFLNKRNSIQFSNIRLLLINWRWKRNIISFFLPLFLFLISIVTGILSKQVLINKLDNASTLILSTIFDIPAIYIFSITSILIEEIFFRGFILSTFLQKRSRFLSIILTSVIWIIYVIPEIIGIEGINSLQFFLFVLFFFSVGTLCSVITEKYKSIWFGYSLRVGLITLAPILITSFLSESDSFFTSESLLFFGEGIAVSFLMVIVSFMVYRTVQPTSTVE